LEDSLIFLLCHKNKKEEKLFSAMLVTSTILLCGGG
jgi:hypothetical protein